ncbi:MAG: carboxypeptidase regulatory-like domain-containing protein, partial [Acidobacteria bacterium]|nr:carboxypeptidase regulatory-like domain-containing protein [Acidobacteriota bacterium]
MHDNKPMRFMTSGTIALTLAVAAFAAVGRAEGSPLPPQAKPAVVAPQVVTSPAVPQAPSLKTASVTGRITALPDNTPVVRARVTLSGDEIFECPPNNPPGRTDNCVKYKRVAITDANGQYTIDKLPRGKTFVVTADKTGYSPRGFGETPPSVPPVFIELKDGEKKLSVDIQLVRQNYMTGTLSDEDGTPFAGALVEALRAVYVDNKRTFVTAAQSVTDDRGQYRLYGLAPGQYYVTGFDPAYANVGDELGQLFYGPTFYPGTVYQDDAVRITLDPGAPTEGLDFKLKIVRPARLEGKLMAPGLQLLAGAVNLGPSRNVRSASFAIAEADIQPDGKFQFANILAERYIIRARGEVERQGLSHFSIWTQPVEGADVSGVDMLLSPGALVAGRVKWEGKMSRAPVDQSAIKVRAPMLDGSMFGDALTGDIKLDTSFALKGAMAGFHYIRMEGLPEPWRLKRVNWRGADVTDIPIEFEYRGLYDGFEVILTDIYTSLSGTANVMPNDLAQGYAVIAFPTNR